MAEILKKILSGLDISRVGNKILIALLLAGTVAVLGVLWLWTQKSDFQVLYTNLEAEDAQNVINRLIDLQIPYKLSSNGGSILISSDQVHRVRLQMASEGLPQGGSVGFEIFDRSTIGTTEFVQKLNYRRALQGELSRTISQIKEVSSARVHLVVPENTLFSNEQQEARASVVLRLVSNGGLSEKQVQGIVYLVASSVERLNPQAVTVIDGHGRILTKVSDDSSSMALAGSNQLEFQHSFEKKLENKIRGLLEPIVGINKAIVRVSSDLELRQVEITEEKFDPDTQVARSEQRTQEKFIESAQSPNASGVPGLLEASPGGAGASSQNTSEKKNEVVNYEISKTISRIIEPLGRIKKLSVAVLVDGTYETITNEAGETTRNYISRTDEEMNKLESLVKGAMGFSDERQDSIEVVNIPFLSENLGDASDLALETSLVDSMLPWWPFIRYSFGILLIMIVIMAVVRPLLKELLAKPESLPGPAQAESFSQLQNPTVTAAVSERDKVISFTKDNPQVATAMVKKWIKDTK